MPRPPGSGKPNTLGETTNFTLRVGVVELAAWRQLAKEMKMSTGMLVRAAVSDYQESGK